jgi:hypothetical protein
MCDLWCSKATEWQCPKLEGGEGHDGTMGTPDDVPCTVSCNEILDRRSIHAASPRECIQQALTCEQLNVCLPGGDHGKYEGA